MLKKWKDFKISILEMFCTSLIQIIISIVGFVIFSVSLKNNTDTVALLGFIILVLTVWSIIFSMTNFDYCIIEIIKGKKKFNKSFKDLIKQKYPLNKYDVKLMIFNTIVTIILIMLIIIYLFI